MAEGEVGKVGVPVSKLSDMESLFKNIGLDKQFFTGAYQFDWKPNPKNELLFKLVDLEFVNNQNVSNYFNVYRNSYDRLNDIASEIESNENWYDENQDLKIPDGTRIFMNAVLNNETIIGKIVDE